MPDNDARYNRDDDQKPGSPPRSATEPARAEGSARSAKTQTDPPTGEPRKTAAEPGLSAARRTRLASKAQPPRVTAESPREVRP